MEKLIVYVHGKGGNAGEADHYKPLFEKNKIIGFDYRSNTPWEAKDEFPSFFESLKKEKKQIILIANSIGAFFSMSSLDQSLIDEAYFISPVVDMEKLIQNMMTWAGVSESELKEKGEIPTDFGETLSWNYLCYVREHSLKWNVPTRILYGEKDNLTSLETISDFAEKIGAELTVMKNGGHWFHTKEQMDFLDKWIKKCRR